MPLPLPDKAAIHREYEHRRAAELLGDRSESPVELWMAREAFDDYVDACILHAARNADSMGRTIKIDAIGRTRHTLVERREQQVVLLPWPVVATSQKVVQVFREEHPLLASPNAATAVVEACSDFVRGDPPLSDAEFLELNVTEFCGALWKIRYAIRAVKIHGG